MCLIYVEKSKYFLPRPPPHTQTHTHTHTHTHTRVHVIRIQSVSGGIVNILGGGSMDCSE